MSQTILIVDDFANTRYATRLVLERQGYTVFEAGDGQEALSVLDGKPVDLVITDYNMPQMNGVELIYEIRKISTYKYIPILLLSTETDEEKKQAAKEAGITGWIHKPFTFDRFLAIVKKALKKK